MWSSLAAIVLLASSSVSASPARPEWSGRADGRQYRGRGNGIEQRALDDILDGVEIYEDKVSSHSKIHPNA